MEKSEFLNQENWWGSYYELAMEYYPRGDDKRLLTAIQAIWNIPQLIGPWLERENFGKATNIPTALDADNFNHLYGVLKITDYQHVGCLTLTVREEEGSDWLDFCIPTGMLAQVFPIEDPLLRESNPWLPQIDNIFLDIAKIIYQVSPFNLALIGEEVSGYTNEKEIRTDYLDEGGYILPSKLYERLNSQVEPVILCTDLYWFPFNK